MPRPPLLPLCLLALVLPACDGDAHDTSAHGDDTSAHSEDTSAHGDDTEGGDDSASRADDTSGGGDDTSSGGDDTSGGDTAAARDCTGGTGWSARSDILTVGGSTAYVKVPEGLPACAPLVVFGHGSSLPGGYADGEWIEILDTGLAALADERGFVLIVPGVDDAPTNAHSWSASAQGSAEVEGFVEAAWAGADIDRGRTWFFGQSAGGFMAGYLGLYAPDIWAGIGVVSAGINPGYYDYPTPAPAKKLPFYVAHDPNDAIVPYSYGVSLADALDANGHVYVFEDWSLGGNGHLWTDGLSEAILDWLEANPAP